jgi:hypothetical protein
VRAPNASQPCPSSQAVLQQQLDRLGPDTQPSALLLPARAREMERHGGGGRGGDSDDGEGGCGQRAVYSLLCRGEVGLRAEGGGLRARNLEGVLEGFASMAGRVASRHRQPSCRAA